MVREAPRIIAATPVRAGREAAFEAFVDEVIVPASRQVKPHLADGWQLVRPAEDQPADATSAYVFLFYGEAALEDWDLGRLFLAAYGEDESKELLRQFDALVEGEQTVYVVEPLH